ncbi:MAG: TAXI family TRAP transporter solute-binding subunit [Planifilum sp.]
MKRVSFIIFLASLLVLSACGGGSGADDRLFLTIATGGQSGVYYPLGATLGQLYETELGAQTSVQATGASVENINLLDKKRAELAIIMGDAASQAYEGTGPFDKKVQSFAAVAALYPNYVQVITTVDTGIETIEDLKGKRVGVGAPNSGVELNARAILEAHGMSYEDFDEDYLSYSEAIDGIKNGTVDAAFVTSGIPNPAVTDLSTSHKVKVIPIEGKGMKKLKELYPYYAENTIPKDTYGNKEDVPTASIMNLLVVQTDLDEETVYRLTKTMFENLKKVHNAHNAAKEIQLETAKESVPIPFHPGAEKYFEEAGVK